MKTGFGLQKFQLGVRRCKQRFLTAGLLAAFMVAVSLMTTVRVTAKDTKRDLAWQQSAQETGGYWQLLIPPEVDEVPDEKKHMEDLRSDVVCGTFTNSLSEGSFTHTGEVYEGKNCWDFSANVSFVATWSRPPDRIIPGTPLSLAANVSKTVNTQPGFGGSLFLDISTDSPHSICGYTDDAKDVCRLTVSSNDSSDNSEDCVLEVGAGSTADDQFALRYCVHAGSGYTGGTVSGYRYIYQWVPAEEKPADSGPAEVEDPDPEPPKPDPPKSDDSEPDTDYQGPSSSDTGSSSSGGSGSILGPLAVLGTLGTLGVGVLGVVGAAAIAILVAVIKGGGVAGPAVGSAPVVETGSVDDLLDELLEELDREIEAPEETDEAPEPETKKKPRRREDETDPETDALDEVEAPDAEEELEDQEEGGQTETESTEDVGESEAEAELDDPGEEPEAETEATEDGGESEAEGEIEESGDAPDVENKEPVDTTQKKRVERKENEATIGEPSGDVDWTKHEIDYIRSKLRVELEAMKDQGIFIGNKTGFRKWWNATVGQITNRIRGWNKNSYCGEMVELGKSHLQKILPDAHISDIVIERNGKMNHIANRVILKDGTEIIVDYWESLATGKPAIYTPEAWLKKWEKELGKLLWGDWLRRDLIDNDQIGVVRHVLKHGEGGVESFRKGKPGEPLRNWWKNLDPEKKKTLKDQVFQKLSPKEQERYIY